MSRSPVSVCARKKWLNATSYSVAAEAKVEMCPPMPSWILLARTTMASEFLRVTLCPSWLKPLLGAGGTGLESVSSHAGGFYGANHLVGIGGDNCGTFGSAGFVAVGETRRRRQRSRFHIAIARGYTRKPEGLSWQVGRSLFLSQGPDSRMLARGPQLSS